MSPTIQSDILHVSFSGTCWMTATDFILETVTWEKTWYKNEKKTAILNWERMRLSFFLSLSSWGGYIDVYAPVYTRTTTAVVCVGVLVVCSRATVNRNKRQCNVVKALYQHPFLRRLAKYVLEETWLPLRLRSVEMFVFTTFQIMGFMSCVTLSRAPPIVH